eukprot:PhF_6_TR40168/c0_g1_i1/m.59502
MSSGICWNLFQILYRYVSYPFLDDDTFVQRCRKFMGSTGPIISILNILYIGTNTSTIIALDVASRVGLYIDACFFIVLFPIFYLQMRSARNVSDGNALVYLFAIY